MGSWFWWTLVIGFSVYFILLLIDFNRPFQRLMDQLENQQTRGQQLERRLELAQGRSADLRAKLDALELEMMGLEEQRQEMLPSINTKTMVGIPAGSFVMGSQDEDSPHNERPARSVYLSTFYINKYPTTNAEYREFVQCTARKSPSHWQRSTYPADLAQHPVVNISWHDAQAYANWRGARLPTEAEWEKAARGTDERRYPWGNRYFDDERCNSSNQIGTTTPVTEYPHGRSPYEVWDLCGNVYEWCADYYQEDYYKWAPPSNPQGPEGVRERIVRGGCFADTRLVLRVTHRVGIDEAVTRDNIGFRIAMDAGHS